MTAGDRAGRDDLALLVAPLPVERFLAEHWRRAFTRLAGEPGRFDDLFGWDRLNRLFETVDLSARVRLVREGAVVERSDYLAPGKSAQRIDPARMQQFLAAGHSLVVDHLELVDPGMADLAESLSRHFDARCWINLYATFSPERALALHWDDHDIFVVQLAGAKDWTVHGPTYPDPVRSSAFVAPAAEAEPLWSGRLAAGDALYLPRGLPHCAVAREGPSLHLAIALESPTGWHFATWLAERLAEEPFFRGDLPGPDARAAWLAEARRRLAQAADSDALDDFTSWRRAREPVRARLTLPQVRPAAGEPLTDATPLRLALRRAVETDRRGGKTVKVSFGSLTVTCARSVADRLCRLDPAQALTLAELTEGLDAAARHELARLLAMARLSGDLA